MVTRPSFVIRGVTSSMIPTGSVVNDVLEVRPPENWLLTIGISVVTETFAGMLLDANTLGVASIRTLLSELSACTSAVKVFAAIPYWIPGLIGLAIFAA